MLVRAARFLAWGVGKSSAVCALIDAAMQFDPKQASSSR
jgi:hypothetical protein